MTVGSLILRYHSSPLLKTRPDTTTLEFIFAVKVYSRNNGRRENSQSPQGFCKRSFNLHLSSPLETNKIFKVVALSAYRKGIYSSPNSISQQSKHTLVTVSL